MEDIKNDGADKTTPTVIQLEPVETKIEINDPSPVVMPFWQNQPQQPPPYNPNYPPPQQNYYYNDPSYNQRGTPAYQQRVGGQNVYTTVSWNRCFGQILAFSRVAPDMNPLT
jgi:hypothetical protein